MLVVQNNYSCCLDWQNLDISTIYPLASLADDVNCLSIASNYFTILHLLLPFLPKVSSLDLSGCLLIGVHTLYITAHGVKVLQPNQDEKIYLSTQNTTFIFIVFFKSFNLLQSFHTPLESVVSLGLCGITAAYYTTYSHTVLHVVPNILYTESRHLFAVYLHKFLI